MDVGLIIYIVSATVVTLLISIPATYFIVNRTANKKAGQFNTLENALASLTILNEKASDELKKTEVAFRKVNHETQDLQLLYKNADSMKNQLNESAMKLKKVMAYLKSKTIEVNNKESVLHNLLSKIDIYSRIDDFVDVGFYEHPEYMYETSARFAEEIRRIREEQKEYIKDNKAVETYSTLVPWNDVVNERKITSGMIKLMLTTFNIETDLLISKLNPSNYSKILERIEKLANSLEKSSFTLNCGFNIKYVGLKMEECRLQYQFTLKKKDEMDEQRLIKERIREEQKAIKEYEKEIASAEKEEKLYRDLLSKAKAQLESSNETEKNETQHRITLLEAQLIDAEAKIQRTRSMAEQTRKGHVYVISNIGSFGKNVYKIGMTRRLDPMDRVKELGDASVPFTFDVHAMIYTDDAPTLEKRLHQAFRHKRVNAVNLRKEFFNVSLSHINQAVNEITELETDFVITALAEEYFESKRLTETLGA
jgi:hypothetical protein